MPNPDGSPTFFESLNGLIQTGGQVAVDLSAQNAPAAAPASMPQSFAPAASAGIMGMSQKTLMMVGGGLLALVVVIFLVKRK